MSERFRFDPGHGRCTVQAFAGGMLSALGHSPTFAVRDYGGEMRFEGGKIEGLSLELSFPAGSLTLMDQVSDADHREIEQRMRRDVLETSDYPEIAYHASGVPAEPTAQGEYHVRLGGQLTLHGVTRDHPVEADLKVFLDAVQLRGMCALHLSDYRIRPVTALGGAIRLKDELRLEFDLVAFLERP